MHSHRFYFAVCSWFAQKSCSKHEGWNFWSTLNRLRWIGCWIFRPEAATKLSLAYLESYRIISGCIELNVLVSLLSTIALVAVLIRRFDLFIMISLLLLATASLAVSYFQIYQVFLMHAIGKTFDYNEIGGVLVEQILTQITSFALFGTVHCQFALQYLLASITVPLYFER